MHTCSHFLECPQDPTLACTTSIQCPWAYISTTSSEKLPSSWAGKCAGHRAARWLYFFLSAPTHLPAISSPKNAHAHDRTASIIAVTPNTQCGHQYILTIMYNTVLTHIPSVTLSPPTETFLAPNAAPMVCEGSNQKSAGEATWTIITHNYIIIYSHGIVKSLHKPLLLQF